MEVFVNTIVDGAMFDPVKVNPAVGGVALVVIVITCDVEALPPEPVEVNVTVYVPADVKMCGGF